MAAFFRRLGFRLASPERLRQALLDLARNGIAERSSTSVFGQKYVVRGIIRGPVRSARVVAVWIVLFGEAFPRFVTAYPEESSDA